MEAVQEVIRKAKESNFRSPKKEKKRWIKNRTKIHSSMVKKYGSGFAQFSELEGNREMKRLFRLYDKRVFGGALKSELAAKSKSLKIQVTKGSENSRAGGWCKTRKDGYVLSFPSGLYTSLFSQGGEEKNGGILCSDRLGALQITLEHELIHLLMQLTGNHKKKAQDSTGTYTSHGKLFRFLTNHFFGHTEFHHAMGYGDPSTWSKLSDFSVGDYVKITSQKKQVGTYYARVDSMLIKYIVVTKRDTNQRMKVRPELLKKVSREEYGDRISDIPLVMREKVFATGDYVKFSSRQGKVQCGIVQKKMIKNLRVSTTNSGRAGFISGHPSIFTIIDREEYMSLLQ